MTPRLLHPVAWWVWGILVGAAAIRTANPLLSGLLIGSVWLVVAARRREVPWSRSFGGFLRLGIFVLVLRLVLQALFAPRIPGHVLVVLPHLTLPDWAAGVSLGGPVSGEALLQAGYESLRLIGLLAAVGAANSLADPYRLLRAIPTALYEIGVAVTVALSLAPQAGVATAQVREARRLRGRPTRGLAGVRGVALPALESALDRSISMAASMDARGFGRRALVPPGQRRLTSALVAGGLLAAAVGVYGILGAGGASGGGAGVPALVVGAMLLGAGLVLGGARTRRTRYRPDPWGVPEWATVACGVATLGGFVVAGRLGLSLTTSVSPLALPTLPVLPAVAGLLAALPAVLTPEPSP